MTTRAFLALLLLTALLAGCGQKGPLYLPDEPPAQEQEDDEDDSGG